MRPLVDDQGIRWEARPRGPAGFGQDLVRFTAADGAVRVGGIPSGSWDRLSTEELELAFLRSQLLPGHQGRSLVGR